MEISLIRSTIHHAVLMIINKSTACIRIGWARGVWYPFPIEKITFSYTHNTSHKILETRTTMNKTFKFTHIASPFMVLKLGNPVLVIYNGYNILHSVTNKMPS